MGSDNSCPSPSINLKYLVANAGGQVILIHDLAAQVIRKSMRNSCLVEQLYMFMAETMNVAYMLVVVLIAPGDDSPNAVRFQGNSHFLQSPSI